MYVVLLNIDYVCVLTSALRNILISFLPSPHGLLDSKDVQFRWREAIKISTPLNLWIEPGLSDLPRHHEGAGRREDTARVCVWPTGAESYGWRQRQGCFSESFSIRHFQWHNWRTHYCGQEVRRWWWCRISWCMLSVMYGSCVIACGVCLYTYMYIVHAHTRTWLLLCLCCMCDLGCGDQYQDYKPHMSKERDTCTLWECRVCFRFRLKVKMTGREFLRRVQEICILLFF